MARAKIIITDFIADDLAPEKQVLGELADLVALDAYDEEQMWGQIEDADAVMMYHNLAVTRKTIERLRQCKLIVRCGVGFDNVDRAAARERGIPVGNVPDYGTEEVADSAIGFLLAMTRGITLLNSWYRAVGNNPWLYTPSVPLYRLRGQTLGLVGLGRIGSATALRAKALGMDVAFYDPYVPDGRDKSLGVRRCETIEELFRQSFAVSLHCPLNEQSRHIVNAESLGFLPRAAYLVNTARGAVVDTTAIPDAIASGQLAGAAIDVLEREPPTDDDPLVRAWRDPQHPAHHRVLINPHSAFYSQEGMIDMRVKGSEACRRALLGLPLRNIVN